METDAEVDSAVFAPPLPATARNVVETWLVAKYEPAVDALSAPSAIAKGAAIDVTRAIPKKPTSRLLARVEIAGPVVIDIELTAFGEPAELAIGLRRSTPAKALIVPAAPSGLENVQVQVDEPVSEVPAA